MYKSLIKYLTVSYFFLLSMNIYGNIMLDEKDKLTIPLPLPYDGKIYNVKDLNRFIEKNYKPRKTTHFDVWC